MIVNSLKFSDLHTVNSATNVLLELGESTIEEVCQVLHFRSLVIDSAHGVRAMELAAELGYLKFESGTIKVTAGGKALGELDELNALRLIFKQTLIELRRDLLWIAYLDEESLKEHDINLYRVTKNLRLWSRSMEKANLDFWNTLKSSGKYEDTDARLRAGRLAEEKTIEFEKNRLESFGFSDLSNEVRWVSQDSDLHGYDVLSFTGRGEHPLQKIQIEVKSVSHSHRRGRYFFLSRNEFDQATVLQHSYFFYLWNVSNELNDKPVVVPAHLVLGRVPDEGLESGSSWTERIIFVDSQMLEA